MQTTQTAPKDHPEEYFSNRIKELQDKIKENLPDESSEAMQAFLASCVSWKSAKNSLEKVNNLLQNLQKEGADDATIQKAQDVVDACNQTVENTNILVTSTGRIALEEMDLSKIGATSLLECTVLVQSTPKGLADFCALDPDKNGSLVDEFLSNSDWMEQMIRYGGAAKGHYGTAISIHSQLLMEIADQPTKVRRKLALATALEHATPISVFQHADTFIDPISRFWHYVHAFENGELDKAFENFTVWELRLVVDSNAPNDQLQWGRDFLKAYRPDEVLSNDEKWKYVWAVRTDVGYRHPDHAFDSYQSLISAGGECGARAWFGRFIAKAFGMPTWGVRQPGHAAMSRWTPSGWIVCLGSSFGFSWWDENRYAGGNKSGTRRGPDFLEETQARSNTCEQLYYLKLNLLECLAESIGETVKEEVDPSKLWRSLALAQRRIFAKQENSQLDEKDAHADCIGSVCLEPGDGIHLDPQGRIIIQAADFIEPDKPNSKVLVMPSFLGGQQLHLEHDGSVTYQLPSTVTEGSYSLSCRVVNVHQKQVPLLLTVESSDGDDDMAVDLYSIGIEYTIGSWKFTKGVEIQLAPGCILKFSREDPCWGLSIKEFILESCEP